MRFTLKVTLILVITALLGCSPSLNWRDVQPEQAPLSALFPCKPEQNMRGVNLGGHEVKMKMLGCEAGGLNFALAYADMKTDVALDTVLSQWRLATLGNLQAQSPKVVAFQMKGSQGAVAAVRVEAQGKRQDGAELTVQALWFAVGPQVFQATVLSDKTNAIATETFFEGVRIQ